MTTPTGMSQSTLNSTGATYATRRAADLLLAWIDAANEVQTTYAAWRDGARTHRDTAFHVYLAALDREAAAARALELDSRRCGRDRAML